MEEVVFTSYPKKGKRYFKTGTFRQKPLSVQTADNAVREYAATLSKHKSEEIAFTVTFEPDDPNATRAYEFDNVITAEDQTAGLMGIIDRDVDSDDQKLNEAEQADLDDLRSELLDDDDQNPDLEEEEGDDDLDDAFDDDDDEEDDDEPESSKPAPEPAEQAPAETAENVNNDVLPAPGEAKAEASQKTFLSEDAEAAKPAASENAAPEERAAPSNGAEKAEAAKPEAEVTASADFENPDDIINRLPEKYDANQFALDLIREQLGFKAEPKDKYEEEFNRKLEKVFKDKRLDSIQGDYDAKKNSLENGVIDSLTNKYNEITKETLTNAIDRRTASAREKLTAAAKQAKAKNRKQAETALTNETDRLAAEKKAKVAKFENDLDNSNQEHLRKFKADANEKLDQQNDEIDQLLDQNEEQAKAKERETIVHERNQALAAARQRIINSFNQGVKDAFTKFDEEFRVKLDAVVIKAQEIRAEIAQEKEADEEKAARKAMEAKKQALKEKELAQKQKEIDLSKQQMEDLPKAIARAINEGAEKTQKQALEEELEKARAEAKQAKAEANKPKPEPAKQAPAKPQPPVQKPAQFAQPAPVQPMPAPMMPVMPPMPAKGSGYVYYQMPVSEPEQEKKSADSEELKEMYEKYARLQEELADFKNQMGLQEKQKQVDSAKKA